MAQRTHTYKIKWRGKITRDVGEDECLALTASMAFDEYERIFPTREVVSTVRIKPEPKP